jgi:hypothetical protein
MRIVNLVMLLSALAACRGAPDGRLSTGGSQGFPQVGEVEDHWSSTFAACGGPDPWAVYEDAFYEGFRDDEDCQAALNADLGMDLESMESALYLGLFQDALLALMGSDLGDLDELDELPPDASAFVRPPLVASLHAIGEETGRSETQAALYNLVTSSIVRVELVDSINDGAATGSEIEVDTGKMYTTGSCIRGRSPWMCAGVLVHEAAHVWNPTDHVVCPEGLTVDSTDVGGRTLCDDSWNSAYGFQGGAVALLDHHMPVGGTYEDSFRVDASFILDLVDALVIVD